METLAATYCKKLTRIDENIRDGIAKRLILLCNTDVKGNFTKFDACTNQSIDWFCKNFININSNELCRNFYAKFRSVIVCNTVCDVSFLQMRNRRIKFAATIVLFCIICCLLVIWSLVYGTNWKTIAWNEIFEQVNQKFSLTFLKRFDLDDKRQKERQSRFSNSQ